MSMSKQEVRKIIDGLKQMTATLDEESIPNELNYRNVILCVPVSEQKNIILKVSPSCGTHCSIFQVDNQRTYDEVEKYSRRFFESIEQTYATVPALVAEQVWDVLENMLSE